MSKTTPEEQARRLLLTGIRAADHGTDAVLARTIEQLLRLPITTVEGLIEEVTRTMVTALIKGGWQPQDLDEIARRRVDALGRAYLLDWVAGVTGQHSAATIDPRWLAQLDEVGAQTWWDSRRPHLLQWRHRQGLHPSEAFRSVLGLHALLQALPQLQQLMLPPGSARPASSHRISDHPGQVDEKVLARIRALLAKAESTEFPEEAESLSGKAQELMTRFSLDRALVEASAPDAPKVEASARRIWLDAPYVKPKSMLVGAVAKANHCRSVLTEDLGFTTVLGEAVDIQLVEILATSLLVQASRAMHAGGSRVGAGGQSRTRSYRQSFLVSYAGRISERLTQATTTSEASIGSVDSSRLHPVLVAREERTEELFTRLFPRVSSYAVKVSNSAGWADGRAAADRANIEARTAIGT